MCTESAPFLADWLAALSNDSPFVAPEATRAGNPPPLRAVPSLLSLLRDDSPAVRRRAAEALGDLAGEMRRVLPAVRSALKESALRDADELVRVRAAQSLLRAGPQPATEVAALADALESDVDLVRFHAAVALGDLGAGGRLAVPALIHACLRDGEPAVRVEAAMALWKIDDQKAPLTVRILVEALADPSEMICWVATECLGQMGPAAAAAAPALRRALRRPFRLALVKEGVRLALERIVPRAQANGM
jgi:HEAT repeat protein